MASLVFITQAKLQNSSGGETLLFVEFRGSSKRNSATKDPWNLTVRLPSSILLILASFLWISLSNQLAASLLCHWTLRSSPVLENHPIVISQNYRVLLSLLVTTLTFGFRHHPLAGVKMGLGATRHLYISINPI